MGDPVEDQADGTTEESPSATGGLGNDSKWVIGTIVAVLALGAFSQIREIDWNTGSAGGTAAHSPTDIYDFAPSLPAELSAFCRSQARAADEFIDTALRLGQVGKNNAAQRYRRMAEQRVGQMKSRGCYG